MQLEKDIQRALFHRRLLLSSIGFVLLLLLAVGGFLVWRFIEGSQINPPSYEHLDKTASTYWVDRTELDIKEARAIPSKPRSNEMVYRYVTNTMARAKALPTEFERLMAIYDIALTMAKHDVDVNIDDTLRNLGDTPLAQSLQGRIYVSQGLMHCRMSNPNGARVAIQEYNRLVIDADLKLDSLINDMSFCGAVTALAYLKNTTLLNDMFKRQVNFTLRVDSSQRMKAYRFIAVEQARVGFAIDAMETVKKIDNPLERVRAYQLIIAYTARQPKIEPVEPSIATPQTEGPWPPIQNIAQAKRIVNDVLQQIAQKETADEQINLLVRLAGSRLMCDPEIHRLLKEALVEDKQFDELIKRPAVKLLDNPESEVIRKSLNMPPPKKNKPSKTEDPALDDWTSSMESLAVDMIEMDPGMVKTLNDQQTVRALCGMAQSYLIAARHQDAARILQRAYLVARQQSNALDRVRNLMAIAEQQMSTGNLSEARTTLAEIVLPAEGDHNEENSETSRNDLSALTQNRLSDLARLQTVGRFFDEALNTIRFIDTVEVRDADYAFLAMEQIRILRPDDAAKTISKISDETRRQTLEHYPPLLRDGDDGDDAEEHFAAIQIPYPNSLRRNSELKQCCELLIYRGLFGVARETASRITNPESSSQILARIVREYMLLFRAYSAENEFHQTVRKELLEKALEISHEIEDPLIQTTALQSVLADSLAYSKKQAGTRNINVEFLQSVDAAFISARKIIDNNAAKAKLMSQLVLARIAMESGKSKQTVTWPLIDRELNTKSYEPIRALIDETLAVVNESDSNADRGYALSNLAAALGQIGRFQSARIMLGEAEATAQEISDKQESVGILLSTAPTYRMIGETENMRQAYYTAFGIIMEAYVDAVNSSDPTLDWRLRDSELDRIVRSQLEQDLLVDAFEYANRINEPNIKDRLLRALAYIHLDHKENTTAESIARKIEVPELFRDTIRDVLFLIRQSEKGPLIKPAE